MTTASITKLPLDDLTITPVNFARAETRFSEKPEKFLQVSKFKTNGNRFNIAFTGQMCTGGINFHEFEDGGKSYTVGIELDQDTMKALIAYESKLTEFATDVPGGAYNFVDCVKEDDKIYVKLKPDASGKSFMCKSNIKISPKNYSEASMYQTVTYEGELGVYFNVKSRDMGLTLTTREINFY